MILSHKHKFIFICNGRTGTTSIECGLLGLDESLEMNGGCPGLWDGKHMPAAVAKAMLPKDVWRSYFKFAFVRNPCDWVVSQFRHNFNSRCSLRKILRHPTLAPGWLAAHWGHRCRRKKRILDTRDVEFLFAYLRRYRGLPLSGGLYQSNYVRDADGHLIVDFVGKFESLRDDLQCVQDKIGISFELAHLNASDRPHRRCSLTAAAEEKIRHLWRVDFENFGYSAGGSHCPVRQHRRVESICVPAVV